MSKWRFRNAAERSLIQWAKANGWEIIGRNSQNHMNMRHIESGKVTRIPSKLHGAHIDRAVRSQLKPIARNAPWPNARSADRRN